MTPPPAAAAAAPAVRPRRPLAPRGPRRVSGPARPARPAQGARSRRVPDAGIALGLVSGLEALAQHRLLERLIRGRTWIGIVAFALIGIVTLQLGLLKLNGGIGRALEHEAALQRQNAALSIENSELAAGSRVEARATQLGMAFVPVGSLRFLASSSHGDIGKAAAALSAATRSSSVQGAETTASGGESGEAASAESQPTPEGETATASSSQATSQASATSGQGGESAAGEAPVSAESGVAASGESTSGESTAPSASVVTGAGGGVQAASGG